jgi:arsenate reductase
MMSLYETARKRRLRLLFVCFANACRSQMAEAFANAYAANLLDAESAGHAPAKRVSRKAAAVMAEKGLHIADQTPRSLRDLDTGSFDLIVNLSGRALPDPGGRVLAVPVPDPSAGDLELHREVRDSIERLVRILVIKLQSARAFAS